MRQHTATTIAVDTWSEGLPVTPETVRHALRSLEGNGIEILVEQQQGIALRVLRSGRHRYLVTRLLFRPTDRVCTAASHAVSPAFDGSVRPSFFQCLFGRMPVDRTWSETEVINFIEAFAGLANALPPHKWLAQEA